MYDALIILKISTLKYLGSAKASVGVEYKVKFCFASVANESNICLSFLQLLFFI